MRKNSGRFPLPTSTGQFALAMVLRAETVEEPPTFTVDQIGSGVLTGNARPTGPSTRVGGSPLLTPMPERIQGNTGTVRQLEDWASFLPQTTRALAFVRRAFAEPHDMSRSIEMSNNANIDGQLSFPRLATLAREWDSLGATTPAEFVDALSAEVVGHPKYEAVCSALRDVSLLPVRFPQEQEPEDAEWMWK